MAYYTQKSKTVIEELREAILNDRRIFITTLEIEIKFSFFIFETVEVIGIRKFTCSTPDVTFFVSQVMENVPTPHELTLDEKRGILDVIRSASL